MKTLLFPIQWNTYSMRNIEKDALPSKVWTTERVNDLLSAVEAGKIELTKYSSNPFWDSNTSWRAADIVFEYTPEEMQELKRCAEDVMYFANKYCYAMTDDGIQNIRLRDYQEDALKTLQYNNKCVWLASRQIGKAQPLTETVWTESGKMKMGQIKTGMKIWGANGRLTNVIGVFPQGELESYRITFDDNSIVECCKDHLWEVTINGVETVLSTDEMIKANEQYSVRTCLAIDFPEVNLNKSPFDIGFAIGKNKLSIEKLPVKLYLFSIGQKISLLQGLMDSCGSIDADDILLSFKDQCIAEQIAETCETLGMKVMKHGNSIRIIDPIMDVQSLTNAQTTRTITSITSIGLKESQCIAVDAEDHLYLTSHCIPTRNTICSGIFLTWYLLFNYDKNLMVLANVGATAREIISKLKIIMQHLPFFMKPGVYVNNQMEMSFDNGCRLFGKATTKTAAIGFAVHFLYVDEFAHIPATFLDAFWRSVYPTLSANKNAKCVITSTPNGMNKFFDIYTASLIPKNMEGANEFIPMRVDYWQVPGRDDEWRKKEIANLGSLEDFNQEYGLQFSTGSKLLLDADSMRSIEVNRKQYEHIVIPELEDLNIDYYEALSFYPKFDLSNIKDDDRFVFAIDTAGGGGGDFSVINIFKIIPMPIRLFKKLVVEEENDAICAIQIGIFRSNKITIEDFSQIFETLLFRIFNENQTRVVLELDFRGALVLSKVSSHPKFYDDIFIHTQHSKAAKRKEIGIKYTFENKYEYCMKLRSNVRQGKLIITEKSTGEEMGSFGVNKKGSYSSQVGHDDLAMTCVSMSAYFNSDQFYEQADDIIQNMGENIKEYTEHVNESLKKQDRDSGDIGLFDRNFMDY